MDHHLFFGGAFLGFLSGLVVYFVVDLFYGNMARSFARKEVDPKDHSRQLEQ